MKTKKTTYHRRERNGKEFIIEIRYYPLEKIAPYQYYGDHFEYFIFDGSQYRRQLARYGNFEHWVDAFEAAQEHWEIHHDMLHQEILRRGVDF